MGILEPVAEYSRLLQHNEVNINIDVNLVRVWVQKSARYIFCEFSKHLDIIIVPLRPIADESFRY